MPNFKEPARFWSKVDVGEPGKCWEWLAHRGNTGYGQFGIHYKLWYSHRVAWTLTYGPIPEGLCVLHKCDNPGCCNPYHLFLGTKADNTADSVRKGRMAKKLTEEDVLNLRKLYATGKWTQQELADEFGINQPTVSEIILRKIWKHIP